MITQQASQFIDRIDDKLNKCAGWEQNEIRDRLNRLLDHGTIECGWRESCSSTDVTLIIHREWVRVVARLRKQGYQIVEDRQHHKNAYAGNNGGFWNSIVYSLRK